MNKDNKTVVSVTQIYIDKLLAPTDDWNDFKRMYSYIQKEMSSASTKAISICNLYTSNLINNGREVANKWVLDTFGKEKLVSAMYSPVREHCKDLYTSITASFSREIHDKYFKGDNSYYKQLLKGTGNPPMTFTNDIPINLVKAGASIKRSDDKNARHYTVSFNLLSRDGVKNMSEILGKTCESRVTFETNAKDNLTYKVLENIVEGNYELCASKLTRKKEKKSSKYKYVLLLSYKHPVQDHSLNSDRIMGIDLGVNIPAMLAVSDSDYYRALGGRKIIEENIKQEKINKLRQSDIRYNCRDGHGRKAKLDGWDGKGHVINNRNDTYNHVLSKQIVDQAIKWQCGTIYMEDLSKIKGDNSDKFLKHWTYFDLQTKIQYKAEQNGIKVKKINPRHTSQRCSVCGYTDKGNRPKKDMGQAYFRCLKCGYETNADRNAAKNIALYDKYAS